MKKLIYFLLGITTLFLLLGSGVVAQELSGTLDIEGSSTVFPVMEEAQLRWQDLHPDVTISVASVGSGGGFEALVQGQTDIAPMSRAPKDSEYQAAADAGLDITEETTIRIGLDALAVIVNPDNPVDTITYTTLRAIYQGNVTTWSEAFPDEDFSGLSSDDIIVNERDQNSGTHDYFNEEILSEEEVDSGSVAGYGQFNAQADLNSAVASQDNAIGYSGLAYVDATIKALSYSPDTVENAVEPSIEAAADATYALARPLFLVYDASVDNNLRDEFLDYMLGEEGQYIVSRVGYVPIAQAASGYTDVETAPVPVAAVIASITIMGLLTKKTRN